MTFDSVTGMLSCESCGHKENIDDYKERNDSTPSSDTNEYHCKNCGAILITDADTSATTCSFCGAGVVLADRLSGKLSPVKVIPFKVNKEQAGDAFKKWCKKGLLTPKGFMNADRIKNITGMYVPFWLYDLNSRAIAEAACTRVRTYDEGDYIITETKHYNVYRDVDLSYMKVPVDASSKMNDQLMDKLEPFHYDDLKDFKTPYLAGYIAEKYNYDDKELFPRVKERVDVYADTYLRSTIDGYTTTTFTREDIQTKEESSYYTLLPVWMVCYDYKNSDHIFAMNGQTGKIVGTPPLSIGKIFTWFFGISAVSFLILYILAWIIGGNI
jgi:DNA-directed RNA polymerase subunit RPC12/RpoP